MPNYWMDSRGRMMTGGNSASPDVQQGQERLFRSRVMDQYTRGGGTFTYGPGGRPTGASDPLALERAVARAGSDPMLANQRALGNYTGAAMREAAMQAPFIRDQMAEYEAQKREKAEQRQSDREAREFERESRLFNRDMLRKSRQSMSGGGGGIGGVGGNFTVTGAV